MDSAVFMTGILIMLARILDVSIGTLRTLVTVQGQVLLAFILGFIEVVIWLAVVGTVITKLEESPILVVFFALGFALGNVVGILAEKKIALGPTILKLITTEDKTPDIMSAFRDLTLDATTFSGLGSRGPVVEIYSVCRRKDLKEILPRLRKIDPEVFYVTEQVRDVSRMLRPISSPVTGWRTALKMK